MHKGYPYIIYFMKLSYPHVVQSTLPFLRASFFSFLLIHILIYGAIAVFYEDVFVQYFIVFAVAFDAFVVFITILGLMYWQAYNEFKYKKYLIYKDHVEFEDYKGQTIINCPLNEFSGFKIKHAGNPSNSDLTWARYKVYLVHKDQDKTFPFARFKNGLYIDEVRDYIKAELGLVYLEGNESEKFFKFEKRLSTLFAIAIGLYVLYRLFNL